MKIALLILSVLVVLIFLVCLYFGSFKKIELSIDETGGETLVYEELIGNYNQSGKLMDKIYNSLLNEDKIETFKGFGIYYDNPQKVDVSKLRSEVGCILEDNDLSKVADLKKKYLIKDFPKAKYLTTEFPYKNKLSILFSLMKVYPAMGKYVKEHGLSEEGAIMEIYDIPNSRILYRKVLSE